MCAQRMLQQIELLHTFRFTQTIISPDSVLIDKVRNTCYFDNYSWVVKHILSDKGKSQMTTAKPIGFTCPEVCFDVY